MQWVVLLCVAHKTRVKSELQLSTQVIQLQTFFSSKPLVKMNNYYIYFFLKQTHQKGVRVMVFNATFSNISIISWRSVLLLEEPVCPKKGDGRDFSHQFSIPKFQFSNTQPSHQDCPFIPKIVYQKFHIFIFALRYWQDVFPNI